MDYTELIDKQQTEDCKINDTTCFNEDNADLQALSDLKGPVELFYNTSQYHDEKL